MAQNNPFLIWIAICRQIKKDFACRHIESNNTIKAFLIIIAAQSSNQHQHNQQ
jgi:hypothetical protein